jgi:hypothetical protein
MLQALGHLRDDRSRPEPRSSAPVPLELAWRKNLGKTRAVMMILSSTCRRPFFGQGASARLYLAAILGSVMACLSVGCNDDEPAGETGVGGNTSIPDASVRDLPGNGLEPTPDFDTDSRQREPIGPQGLVEAIDEIRGGGGNGNAPAAALDAGADAATDAGASN